MKVLGIAENEDEIQEWKAIVAEIDSDGNGEISFEEFKIMMHKLANCGNRT